MHLKYIIALHTLCIVSVSSLQATTSDKIICFEQWPPYAVAHKNGHFSGPVIETLRTVFERLDIPVSFESQSDSRCYVSMEAGNAFARFPVAKGEPHVLFTDQPLAIWKISALVRNEYDGDTFTSLNQFNDMVVLSLQDHFYPEPLYSWIIAKPRMHIVFSFGTQALKLLQYKRADVYFDDEVWLNTHLRSGEFSLKILSPAVAEEPQYFGINPGHPELMGAINTVLSAMAHTGELQAIYAKTPDLIIPVPH